MPLEKQNISLSIDGGMDTKSDDKQLAPVKMALVQNGIYPRPGRVDKRLGYSVLPTTVYNSGKALTASGTTGLAARGNELVQINDGTLFSYSQTESQWIQRGNVIPLKYSRDAMFTQQQGQVWSSDLAVSGNLCAQVAEIINTNPAATTNIYMSLVDLQSGSAIFSDSAIDTSITGGAFLGGANPMCASLNNYLHCFMSEKNGSATTGLYGWKLNTASPTPNTSLTTLATDCVNQNLSAGYGIGVNNGNNPNIFDVCVLGSNYFIAYVSGKNVKVISRDFNLGAVGGTFTQAISATLTAIYSISVCPDTVNNRVYVSVCFNDAGGPHISTFSVNSNLTLNSALATAIPNGGGFWNQVVSFMANGYCYVLGSTYTAPSVNNQWNVDAINASIAPVSYAAMNGATVIVGGTSNLNIISQLGFASKPFALTGPGGGTFINLCTDDPISSQCITFKLVTDPSTFVLSVSLSGQTMFGNFGGTRLNNQIPSVSVIGGTRAMISGEVRTKAFINAGVGRLYYVITAAFLTAPIRQTITLADATTASQSAQLDNNLLVSGGLLMAYDGQNVFENNFLYPPQIWNVTDAGAGNMLAGTYWYIAIYEYVDSNGQVHRSAPSLPVSYTSAASHQTTISYRCIDMKTPMCNNARVVIYRTTAANPNIFYRATNVALSGFAKSYNRSGVQNASDNLSDTTLVQSEETIYTAGNILENDPASGAVSLDVYRGRLFYISDDPFSVYFSKTHVSSEPVNFNGQNAFQVAQQGGANTAVKALDDKLIVFKGDRPYLVFGDAPDDAGNDQTLTTPQPINIQVGCPYPKSIVSIPPGIIFKTKSKGFWLIDRSLAAKYIGDQVEGYNSANVTAAVHVDNTTQVRFTLDSGVCLIYDYYSDKWSVASGISAASATNWNGTYCFVTAAGVVNQETAGFYQDNSSPIVMTLQTGWVHLAGLQGFQRIYRALLLGSYYTGHTLTVKIGYDYEAAFNETHTISPDGVVNQGLNNDVYQFEIFPSRQKCEAIRFQIFDTATGTPGQGYGLSGVELLIGNKSGAYKTPATKKVA